MFLQSAEFMAIPNLIEIGAHKGEVARKYKRRVRTSTAVAVEANPSTFKKLTSGTARYGVIPVQAAISNQDGSAKLHVPTNSHRREAGQSLPTARNSSLLPRAGSSRFGLGVQVETKRLDTLVAELSLEGGVALWIDVEGATGLVFSGGAETMESVKLLLVELEDEAFWVGGSKTQVLIDLLREYGLTLVARDHQAEGQFNGIFVRSGGVEIVQQVIRKFPSPRRGWIRHAPILILRNAKSKFRELLKRLVQVGSQILGPPRRFIQ